MSKVLSLKLQDSVFDAMEQIVKRLGRPRNAYIGEAVAHFNRLYERRVLGELLARESAAVRAQSLRVLEEFEGMEDEPSA